MLTPVNVARPADVVTVTGPVGLRAAPSVPVPVLMASDTDTLGEVTRLPAASLTSTVIVGSATPAARLAGCTVKSSCVATGSLTRNASLIRVGNPALAAEIV